MLKEILFLSVDQMKRRKPSLDTVVVSILDNSEASHRPRLGGFRSVLCLEFEDTYEEDRLTTDGAWPDEPTVEEHARLAGTRQEKVPSLSDARLIVAFLSRFAQAPEQLTLVAHCYGGISRSAAVAAWASKRYRVPLDANKCSSGANKRLLRLLDKAWVEEAPDIPWTTSKPGIS